MQLTKVLKTLILLGSFVVTATQAGVVIEEIKKRGHINCGVSQGLKGFSEINAKGEWEGIDVDYCRALSAAAFGTPDKVVYMPMSMQDRLPALRDRKIDVLVRNTTWTLSREAENDINFVGVNFYDGQGFMVKKDLGVFSVTHLNQASICVEEKTTTYDNLIEYFKAKGMTIKPVVYADITEATTAFFAGKCDVYTSDSSSLAAVRASNTANAYDYIILPELISKEPLGPSVNIVDKEWFNIARWVLFAMLNAEEYGVSSKNVDDIKATTTSPDIKRLLGLTPGMGEDLGLQDAWAYNIIKFVGNYSEIFERNVGGDSPLKLSRGMNALWNNSGLMYAPPIK